MAISFLYISLPYGQGAVGWCHNHSPYGELSATATAFGLYLVAYLAESGGEVGHGSLAAVVDDGDGLLGHRGLYLLDTFDETDVFLDLVLASGAVHLWGSGEAQGVAFGLVAAFGGYARGGQCHQGHTYKLFHTVLFIL